MLIGVHLIIAAHVVQWMVQGLTVSPVEPSESMYTLETGRINAGFIFFVLAILATLIFGRVFCGWGCHVVALQDACTMLMGKMGIRPKPFRSRLLVWAPLLLALYMFVWPTARREVVSPVVRWMTQELGQAFGTHLARSDVVVAMFQRVPRGLPYWMGSDAPFPGFRNAIIVEDFWATFPPWYVAVPFLLVCGFATVYFLGSKGFCTYGCPYGGFFGPADRVALGRIVVNDDCNACGHCTAVCTSNVRVHQEVRDFGMVVDPGCMKCLDCVSTCPNEALSFKLAKPAFLVKPRTPEARAGRVRRPDYDLTAWEELWVFGVGLVLLLCFRGFLNQVPLLMAVAMAGIGAFCVWKLARMLRTPNVRLQNLELRTKGRIRRAGYVFGVCTLALLVVAAWSGLVRASRWWGDYLDAQISTPFGVVFARGYVPDVEDKALATSALAHMDFALPRSEGGWGWNQPPAQRTRMAWLAAVAGDRALAERHLRAAAMMGRPNAQVISAMGQLMGLRGASPQEYEQFLGEVIAAHPDSHHALVALGYSRLRARDRAGAIERFAQAADQHRGADDAALRAALEGLAQAGEFDAMRTRLDAILVSSEKSFELLSLRASVAFSQNDREAAVVWLRKAIAAEPSRTDAMESLGQLLVSLGRPEEAREVFARQNRVLRRFEAFEQVVDPDEKIRRLQQGG